ncbi:SDR family NAD(P)-dependent oxidoreductase [Aquisediminimonas profunda]|uniref:SDR family NAD(P)-dependent oxidoreductase n=1 Tax=Aquisediminimonas profunda TaxID=1550733 RepID=UPI001C63714A|nr:SDR family NAD(P)-dependent oxidoreductase [Aquisediminimonas profunda]
MDVTGRTVLITGASSGLGAHFARLFASRKANVIVGARRIDRVEKLASELQGAGHSALAVALDVTDESSVSRAFDAGEARFGLIDTIIANAGLSVPGRATEVAIDDIRMLSDTNFTGAYLTAREGAKRLIAAGSRETGKGRVVLLGSITSHMTGGGDSAYAALKAGVAHLGRNLAREWVRQGINVNTIQPGYIQTEIAGDWFQTEGGRAHIASFPRRRLQPIESLDGMMLYFASDASACTTGAVIDVDDGQSL